jgi:hypothetical protein
MSQVARLRPKLTHKFPKPVPALGDMLQRLVLIAPEDVHAITLLTRDVLRRAEIRHAQAFQHRPDPTKIAAWALLALSLFAA